MNNMMNTRIKVTMILMAACGAVAFSTGCGQNEAPMPAAAKDKQPAAGATTAQSPQPGDAQRTAAAEQAAAEAQASEALKQAEADRVAAADSAAEAAEAESLAQKAAADKLAVEQAAAAKAAAEKLSQAATATAAEGQDPIQSLIARAKDLIGESKYAEALQTLGELSQFTLSPEQQTVVDGIRSAVQQQTAKAAADKAAAGATQALGNALGGGK